MNFNVVASINCGNKLANGSGAGPEINKFYVVFKFGYYFF